MLEEKEIIERDTPAAPLNIIVVNGQRMGSCPKCSTIVYSSDERCFNCYKALDWRGYDN